jgi:5-formyltetrahydrofolate cyclo-ligase
MSDLTQEAEKSRANKIALRSRLLTARREMTENAQRSAAQALQDQTLAWVRREAPATVAAYVPVGREPGSRALLDALTSLVPRVLLPILLPDNDLDWAVHPTPPSDPQASSDPAPSSSSVLPSDSAAPYAVSPTASSGGRVRTGLSAGRYGLLEPVGDRLGPSALASADLILVPALAVDRAGRRMGRGGGSYDRALARLGQPSPLILALLHDGELIDTVPAEPHDVPVHGVITPRAGVILL